MKKYIFGIIILGSAVAISGFLISQALAQQPAGQPDNGMANVQYPVKELGNCSSESDCKSYCDEPGNLTACLSFGEKNNLMSQEDLQMARQFQKAGSKGPGGCTGKDSCEQYCNDISRIDECVAFAEKNNLMPEKDLAEAKKVQAAIKRGVKPPACGNKKACDSYCSSSDHMEECVAFAEAAGFMNEKELKESKQVLAAIKRGVKPPPCKGKDSCDTYCSQPDNMQSCMEFALEAGFMSQDEKQNSEKFLKAVKSGVKPPACNGKEACDTYCSQDANFEECTNFALAAGFMNEKDAEMARKTGGKGPGGCTSKDSCDTFCNNPDNQETCFQFGKENGMIPEADLKRMEEGQQKMKDSFSSIPPEVLDCISSSLGADVVEKMKTGSVIQRNSGDSINQCFQKFGTQERRPDQNQNDQDQQNKNQSNQQIQPWADMCSNNTELACVDGAGKFVESAKVGSDGKPVCPADSTAKCGNYQQQNQQGQPGNKFQPGPGTVNPGGQQMPQQAGPGGCKGPEECQKYCTSNPEECKNFQPQQNQQGQQGQQKQLDQQNQNQSNQPGRSGGDLGPCGTGPGTCSGIGPDDVNSNKDNGGVGGPNQGQGFNPSLGQGGAEGQPGQFIQGQPGQQMPQQNQTGQIAPTGQMAPGTIIQIEGGIAPQQTPPPPSGGEQSPPPPPPSSSIQPVSLFGLIGNFFAPINR